MIELLKYNLEASRDMASALTGKRYGHIRLTKFGDTSLAEILGKLFKKTITSTSKTGFSLTAALFRKIYKIEKKQPVKKEIIRTPLEILLDIQAKALYRLDLIARRLIPRDMYVKLMERESSHLRKMINLTDAELGLERKKASWQEKMKKGIITVGDKLEKSKSIFHKMKELGIRAYDRTIRAINIERKQNKTLDKISTGVGKVKEQIEKTGKKQLEKITEQINNEKEHKTTSKRISEKIDRVRGEIKHASKGIFGKIWGAMVFVFGLIKGIFGKIFGVGGTLLKGLGGLILKGFSKIPILGKLVPVLTKFGGLIGKFLPVVGKLASFLWPIAAALVISRSIYGAIKAQKKYGDPIGEKLSIMQRAGLGITETADIATGGIFGLRKKLEADVEQAKKHRENIIKSEILLYRTMEDKLKKGTITKSAYNKITRGGSEGISDRFRELKKNKSIVQIGDRIMTRLERYGPGGIKATFKKEVLKKYAKEIAEGKKISSAYISSIEKKAKEAGEVTKEYWKRKAEKAQPIIERTMAPVISTAEMARMRAREKMEELRARAASNKKIQESIEKTKEFQNVMVNNFNRSSNVISSSVSSIANGMQNKMADFNIDPSVLDIIKGDLE
jgi:hypothetical protein